MGFGGLFSNDRWRLPVPLRLRLLRPPLPANTEDHRDYVVGLTVKDEPAEKSVVADFQPRRLTATPTARAMVSASDLKI